MKIASSFLAGLLLAVSLIASATAVHSEDEIVSGQERAQETRKLKYAQE